MKANIVDKQTLDLTITLDEANTLLPVLDTVKTKALGELDSIYDDGVIAGINVKSANPVDNLYDILATFIGKVAVSKL